MAQKRDKKEAELKVPENLPICTSIPSPQLQIPAARSTEGADLKTSGACDPRAQSASSPREEGADPVPRRDSKRAREVTRCSGSGCRKRIGLMGFQCRCGDVFCPEHRYSDRHDCSYDYKTAGREAIARENPVIRAAKLLKV